MFQVKEATELLVITPNEPGILGRVLSTLANAGINLIALNAYADGKRGIFQLITSDNSLAQKRLKSLGYKVKLQKVIMCEIGDRVGAAAEVGVLLGNAAVDIHYCYGSSAGLGKALLVFRTNQQKKALQTLQ
ncbi:MAG: ACT domain-containing protein [Candidatus Aminicenantales bacterium]